jgi:hypothetical protein
MRVAVDLHGRIYVIANNVFEGIVELNPDGTFNRYFGVVDIVFTPMELFWRTIRTQAQRAQTTLWLPVNFTNLTVDSDGFVFATISDAAGGESVKMLNARGENIMRSPNDEMSLGDMEFNTFGINIPTGPSIMTIVDVTETGVVYLFDTNRNRVFAYDQDGYLLFAFGGSGQRQGTTSSVTGMAVAGDRLVFADRGNRSIEVFELTSYGESILTAVERQVNNNYIGAAEAWQQVIDYNPFFQYAYLGVGRALYRQGMYEEAMHYFQLGQSVEYFSMAYQRIRAETMSYYFDIAVLAITGIILVAVVFRLLRKLRLRRIEKEGAI